MKKKIGPRRPNPIQTVDSQTKKQFITVFESGTFTIDTDRDGLSNQTELATQLNVPETSEDN